MDPRRFDRLTQTLARKLRPRGSAEARVPARSVSQSAPPAVAESPSADGTCAYPDSPTATAGRDGQGLAPVICGWESPPSAPASDIQTAPLASDIEAAPNRARRSARRRSTQPLSARELEVATLIARGLKDREIAAALVLSEHTVHAHVRNLLDKLDVASRTQIAAWVATRAPDDQNSLPREPDVP